MKHLVVLTGAGVSAESGLGTFRGEQDGMWNDIDPRQVASREAWRHDREKVLQFYNMRRHRLLDAQPNHAHRAIADLEKLFRISIITQNVDDLHERAGSKNVLHLHGELTKVTSCMNPNNPVCIKTKPLDEPIMIGDKADDGSQLRPYVVLFGENVPNMAKAVEKIKAADIFVVIGTSLAVYPAAGLLKHVPDGIPRYLIDPTEVEGDTDGFAHIRQNATEGMDTFIQNLTNVC